MVFFPGTINPVISEKISAVIISSGITLVPGCSFIARFNLSHRKGQGVILVIREK
jgi:hypothetical protein